MFVIERGGVGWSSRFYIGHNYLTNSPEWGSLDRAKTYSSMGRAKSMSYRIDDEEGIYTTVENIESF